MPVLSILKTKVYFTVYQVSSNFASVTATRNFEICASSKKSSFSTKRKVCDIVKKMVYVDNQDCIELIETKNNGIFHLLDEESKFPSSSRRITTPCTSLLRTSSKKVAIRSSKVRFRLVHLPHRWTTSCLHPLSVNPYLGNVSRSSILRQRQ